MQPGDPILILLALAAIAGLVGLVTRLQVPAFVALLLAALAVGIGAAWLGRPVPATGGTTVPYSIAATLQSIRTGLGGTLGGIAFLLGLGALLGSLLAGSGGAAVLADRLGTVFGPARTGVALLVLGVLVGLATWFAVGLVLLAPILLAVAARPGSVPVRILLPVLAALSITHGLLPPHPGPVVAMDALGVDAGRVLLWGGIVGAPVLLLTGPLLARGLAPRVALTPAALTPAATVAEDGTPTEVRRLPGVPATLLAILLPVALMLTSTLSELVLGAGHPFSRAAAVAGHPTVALLVAVGWSLWALGHRTGCGLGAVRRRAEAGLAAVGGTMLVVGAGGAFAQVLRDAGVADALGRVGTRLHLPPLVYGWLLAVFVRVATGSATVAITTAAGLLVPVLAGHPDINDHQRALLVVALGSGSLCLSHLNDGGFWIVKDCLGLTVGQTLRTWTVCETLIGVLGLAFSAVCFHLVAG